MAGANQPPTNNAPAEEANAEALWARLAAEMRATRQEAGVRPTDWGGTSDVPWTRSHLSNLEHGRGRVTPEIAALYDARFPRPGAPGYFAGLQDAAATATVREADGDLPRGEAVAAAMTAPAIPRPAPRRARRFVVPGLALAAFAVLLVVGVLLLTGRGEAGPPTGARRVCARDLLVRPGPMPVGSESGPHLAQGQRFVVDRYARGAESPHEYAHGHAARVRDGWVLSRFLCP